MASIQIKMGLVIRQVDLRLSEVSSHYPANLPATHIAAVQGWKFPLKNVNGMLAGCTPEEFPSQSPLRRQLEVHRCLAEALLALDRAAEVNLPPADRELLTHRALGILPTDEAARLVEIACCPEMSPHYLTAGPDRFVRGIAEIDTVMGQATALAYGFLIMAGVRSREDLKKYGCRIEDLFQEVTSAESISRGLEPMREDGIESLPSQLRVDILRAVRNGLWTRNPNRPGRPFILTQVIDGYVGRRPGGVGDDLGLAIIDSIVVAKLGFRVGYLIREGRVFLDIAASSRSREYWDPLQRTGEVAHRHMRSLPMLDLFVEGYLRMARGYANTSAHAHGQRVAQWVIGMKPENAEAHQILGQSLLGLQKPREALTACDEALWRDPKLADAYFVRGNAHSALSHWPEAIESYRLAIKHRVGFAMALNNLGLALQRSGDLDRAIGAYREAARVRPDYAEALYNLGNLHLERAQSDPAGDASPDYASAITTYEEAVKIAPNFAAAFYNLGQALYAVHNLAGALEAYKSATRVNPKHAGAWHNMGIVYRDLGQQDLAVEAIEKAVQLNPILLR